MKLESRTDNGTSMVAVICIGVIASLWIAALMGVVLPSYNRSATSRTEVALRSAAEAACDWGINQLNINRSAVDDATEDGAPGPVVTVPPDIVGNHGVNVTATVQVSNEQPPDYSYVYDPTLDPANSATNGGIATNGWRVVTATATRGRMTRTIRVISKPTYTTSPTFDYGAFGRVGVGLNGTAFTDSYDSSSSYAASVQNIGGNVGTNGSISLTGNSVVGGDVRVLSDPPGSTVEVASGTSGVRIEGSLITNGEVHATGGGPDFDSSNVLGNLPGGGTASDPILTQQYNSPRQLPAAPTAPTGAVDLGAVSVTGRDVLTLSAPGSYIMSSLLVSGRGQINITGSGDVKIYVQGTSASVAIGGNGIMNSGRPQNLQIYYNGTSPTSIAGNGTFTGVMYAPNSNIAVSGNGGVYGSVVGNAVTISSTGFHYDRALSNFNPVQSVTLSRNQTISWQEP